MSSQSIGLFDSGVGGLTVLDSLVQRLPQENYVYFGDTLHMPYGSKAFEEIETLVEGILQWLCEEQQVKLVAVACNTSAGVLYETLATRCLVPLVEPITPVCRWLAETATFQKIGLIATPTTVRSNRYATVLQSLNPSLQLNSVGCEGLAKLIEEGHADIPACRALLESYLGPLVAWGMEALILGCTHYPHARKQIESLLPSSIQLLDPAEFMAAEVQSILNQQQLQNLSTTTGQIAYHVSHDPLLFQQTAQKLPLRYLNLQILPQMKDVIPAGAGLQSQG